MDSQHEHSQPRHANLARRGLLAGVAAVVAGILGKATEREARAANGGPLLMGVFNNTETDECGLFNLGNLATALVASTGGTAISLSGGGMAGTTSTAKSAGVYGNGFVRGSFGVLGEAGGDLSAGVRGNSGGTDRPASIGVLGVSDASASTLAVPAQPAGVYGLTTGAAAGVVGQSNNGVGVQGASNGNVGVLGTSNASIGVFASSTASTGLFATSGSGTGIVASTNAGNAIQGASNGNVGVLGTSNSSIGGFFSSGTSTGLFASGPSTGFAARFDGPVQVSGAFTVLGGPKSAAVPHPDGSHRRLYCVESPDSWFEDFGSAQVANGRASVRLDRDFAALVHGDQYQVFLTPEGDSKGLYVAGKTPAAFEVREQQGGTSNLAFSYRVVAKRKDIPGPRLERVDLAAAPPRPAAPPPPPAIPPLDSPRIDPNTPPLVKRTQAR